MVAGQPFIYPARPENAAICAYTALDRWLATLDGKPAEAKAAGTKRYVFPSFGPQGQLRPRGRGGVTTLVNLLKKTARPVGVANPDEIAGHSLRAGFVMAALGNQQPEWQVMAQTGTSPSRPCCATRANSTMVRPLPRRCSAR